MESDKERLEKSSILTIKVASGKLKAECAQSELHIEFCEECKKKYENKNARRQEV